MKEHNAVTHGVVNVPTRVERPPAPSEPLPEGDPSNRRERRRLARLARRARLASQ